MKSSCPPSRVYRLLVPIAGLVLAAVLLEVPEKLIAYQTARKILTEWGLERSLENMRLYLDAAWDVGTADYPSLLPKASSRPGTFSRRWGYADLKDGGVIRVGVYCEEPAGAHHLKRLQARRDSADPAVVQFDVLPDRKALLEAIRSFDLVLFFGHSNLGRGMNLGPFGQAIEIFRMGENRLWVPPKHVWEGEEVLAVDEKGFKCVEAGSEDLARFPVGCKQFWYMGCRSHQYYEGLWERLVPGTDFVGATYAWDSTGQAHVFIEALLTGLERELTLNQIIDTLNRGREVELLRGRIEEQNAYLNFDRHPDCLLIFSPSN